MEQRTAPGPSSCLNCGAALHGAFCSRCGQRVVPPYPTIRELAGDSWQELSGYDGRFLRTFRMLLLRPGALTVEVLEGRRARYVSPVRLYLAASVFFFLVAAAAPNLVVTPPPTLPGSSRPINIMDESAPPLAAAEREEALAKIQRAPSWLRAPLTAVVLDPAGFRNRFRENFPRVLFALVPVFAAIVAIFYRRRRFSQHLVFSLHLHSAAFLALAVGELSNFTGSVVAVRVFQLSALAAVTVYGLMAFRRVYGESWPRIVAKSLGVGVTYMVAGLIALLFAFAWTAFTGSIH